MEELTSDNNIIHNLNVIFHYNRWPFRKIDKQRSPFPTFSIISFFFFSITGLVTRVCDKYFTVSFTIMVEFIDIFYKCTTTRIFQMPISTLLRLIYRIAYSFKVLALFLSVFSIPMENPKKIIEIQLTIKCDTVCIGLTWQIWDFNLTWASCYPKEESQSFIQKALINFQTCWIGPGIFFNV